jgi:SAM-dependent methyltransferase
MHELTAIIQLYLNGRISREITLARMILTGATVDQIGSALAPLGARISDLHQLMDDKREGLNRLTTLVQHAGAPSKVAEMSAWFDQAVGVSPETSVAAYSLGDPAILAVATGELVDWLSRRGLLGHDKDVLDLGCGIGRIAAALAPHVHSILGLDSSPAMINEARRRVPHTNVQFATTSGENLAQIPDHTYDLVLAVDSMPYLVQTGVVERHVADCARILRPNGVLAIFNLSYRGDAEADRADARRWAATHGFEPVCAGETPFSLWDGTVFILQRTHSDLGEHWMTAMRRGDFAVAHAVSDAVMARRDAAERDDPCQPYHCRWVWDGRTFDRRDMLVRCYHGLGDTLMFARFLPLLRRHATSVTIELQPELIDLFATLDLADHLIPFDPSRPTPPSECDIEITELLHALRIGSDRLARLVPYLTAPSASVSTMSARLRQDTLKVGLCWRAGAWSPERSIPLKQLVAACDLAGVQLVSLQRGPGLEELTTIALRFPGLESSNIVDTACLVQNLDLIITVDSMIAHLAGALGRPVFLLLRHNADWRWMQEREDSPWYGTMRLYRQINEGDWAPPLSAVAADLRRWVADSRRQRAHRHHKA